MAQGPQQQAQDATPDTVSQLRYLRLLSQEQFISMPLRDAALHAKLTFRNFKTEPAYTRIDGNKARYVTRVVLARCLDCHCTTLIISISRCSSSLMDAMSWRASTKLSSVRWL